MRKRRKIVKNKRTKRKCKVKPAKKPTKKVVKNICPKPQVEKRKVMCSRHEEFHNKFVSYQKIVEFLLRMETEYPKRFSLRHIGKSTNGRPIYLATVVSTLPTKYPRIATMVEAGLNGCDWMAVSNALYLLEHLVKNQACGTFMDYYVIPCSNPDAYENSFKEHPDKCIQMDLGTNFPTILGLSDMQEIPTDLFLEKIRKWKINFCKSSPESRAVLSAIYEHQVAVRLFVSLQCGGEKLLYPYGFADVLHQDHDLLQHVAKAGVTAIKKRCFKEGTVYCLKGLQYGNLLDLLSIQQSAIKFAYVMEVFKGQGKKAGAGCQSPQSQIAGCGQDTFKCIQAMACQVFKIVNRTAEDSKLKCMTN